MEEKLPIYDLVYRITPEDYEEFNFSLVKSELEKRRKRSRMLGTLEVVVGGLMLVSMLTAKAESQAIYYILDVLLIIMGIYSLSFYKYIFPKKLKKAAAKNYSGNQYLNNDIHIKIYEDCVHEQSYEIDNTVSWDDFSRIQMSGSQLTMVLKSNKCIIVPLREIEDKDKLDEFMTGIHDVWGVAYTKE